MEGPALADLDGAMMGKGAFFRWARRGAAFRSSIVVLLGGMLCILLFDPAMSKPSPKHGPAVSCAQAPHKATHCESHALQYSSIAGWGG